MAKKENWLVRFGPHEWVRHTYERTPEDPLQLLGSVRKGPQVGALGMTADGQYVQVVGDFVVRLNQRQINRAIARYKAFEARFAPTRSPQKQSSGRGSELSTLITVKRRRVPAMPQA